MLAAVATPRKGQLRPRPLVVGGVVCAKTSELGLTLAVALVLNPHVRPVLDQG